MRHRAQKAPSLNFLGTLPRTSPGGAGKLRGSQLGAFGGPSTTLDEMSRSALGEEGERSMLVRSFFDWLVRGLEPKDYLGEILAIRNVFVQRNPRTGYPLFRYANDPRHVEMVKSPHRQMIEILEHGSTVVDCDDSATMAATLCLMAGREVELVAMGFAPGSLSHVAVRAKEPKTNEWIVLDGVAGPREHEAASRAKEIMVKSLD